MINVNNVSSTIQSQEPCHNPEKEIIPTDKLKGILEKIILGKLGEEDAKNPLVQSVKTGIQEATLDQKANAFTFKIQESNVECSVVCDKKKATITKANTSVTLVVHGDFIQKRQDMLNEVDSQKSFCERHKDKIANVAGLIAGIMLDTGTGFMVNDKINPYLSNGDAGAIENTALGIATGFPCSFAASWLAKKATAYCINRYFASKRNGYESLALPQSKQDPELGEMRSGTHRSNQATTSVCTVSEVNETTPLLRENVLNHANKMA